MDTVPVRSAVALTMVGAETPLLVTAELEYHAHDPYAVTAVFRTGDYPVRWVFARDLLDEGLVHDAGDGDVHIAPARDEQGDRTILLTLSSPDGIAVLEASAEVVLEFLGRSYAIVPPGTEAAHLDLDAALARLLGA